jgi:hypothetical protein
MGRYAATQRRGSGRQAHAGGYPQPPPLIGDDFTADENDATSIEFFNTSDGGINLPEVAQVSVVGSSGPWSADHFANPGADDVIPCPGAVGQAWLRCRFVSGDGRIAPQSDWSLVVRVILI